MTLTEFLLARIAEDEVTARESVEHAHDDLYDSPHQARWWSPRVLAECEAKRRIVERERWHPAPGMECAGHPGSFMPHGDYGDDYCFAYVDQWTTETLRDLAAVYADHPDYREEWKP